MYYSDNFKPSEIAKQLGVTRQNVHKHIRKINQRIAANEDRLKSRLNPPSINKIN